MESNRENLTSADFRGPPPKAEISHRPADAGRDTPPSLETILRAMAESAPSPWFPSLYAQRMGVPRDSLDGPLGELRAIGLVEIADWVRGQGQGYVLTPQGEACVRNGSLLSKLGEGPPSLPPPTLDRLLTSPNASLSGPADSLDAWPGPPLALDLRPPTFTPAMVIANLSWFVIGLVVAWRWGVALTRYLATGDHRLLLRMGAVDGPSLLEGEWWRLITCCFVHIGLVHLLANLVALVMTGSLVEMLWGRWRTALIYLFSGLGGSCLAMILHPLQDGQVTLLAGASGSIWGLMTSLLAWLLLNREQLPAALVADWSRKLTLMFLINIGVSFIPGVSWAGHLGGGVAGFLMAGFLHGWHSPIIWRRILAASLILLLPVAFLGALFTAMHTNPAWTALRARFDRDARIRNQLSQVEQELLVKLHSIRPDVVRPLFHLEIAPFVILGRQRIDAPRRQAFLDEIDSLQSQARDALVLLGNVNASQPQSKARLLRYRNFTQAQLYYLTMIRELLEADSVPERETLQSVRRQGALAESYGELLWGPPTPLTWHYLDLFTGSAFRRLIGEAPPAPAPPADPGMI